MLLLQLLFNLWLFKDGINLIENEFENFIHKFDKKYRDNATEYELRKSIFQNSLKQINYLNSFRTHNDSARFGLTKYSDLAPHEFVELVSRNSKKIINDNKTRPVGRQARELPNSLVFDGTIPQSFDWRERKVIGRVRNQGKCGACWAHSIVATVESMLAIQTGTLQELSVQQLVDCSTESGCEGGDTCSTLAWMSLKNVSLQRAVDYPSKDRAEKCHDQGDKPGVRIKPNFTCDSFYQTEHRMVKMLAEHGPLIAAVDASTWQHYLGGTIQYHCYNDLNHAVQITGYDLGSEIPHFKVRNAWDVEFGLDGFVHIAIGNNLCGIAEEVSAIEIHSYSSELQF